MYSPQLYITHSPIHAARIICCVLLRFLVFRGTSQIVEILWQTGTGYKCFHDASKANLLIFLIINNIKIACQQFK